MRLFNREQRHALYVAARGRCEKCDRDLDWQFHADHAVPFSHGGATDVLNGQALCIECNLRKADSGMTQQWQMDLRGWQEKAFRKYLADNKQDWLCVATPGSGKTFFALRVAHHWITAGLVERVVVVVPTEHLKNQWAEKANRIGLYLDPDWTTDPFRSEAKDFHGVIATYQQVFNGSESFRAQCRRKTGAIFDEIHHAGDGGGWGGRIQHACDPCTRRLALTGTAWRHDDRPIPYVRYVDNVLVADETYGYAAALSAGDCRPVMFPRFEGKMTWSRNGVQKTASFSDDLDEQGTRDRLRSAIAADNPWLSDVLRDANRELSAVRGNGHPDAGGLVLASNQQHARAVADVLRRITGTRPVLAVSDDPGAKQEIEQFAQSSAPWIVAVRMISEGVDIPRLRVLVWATDYLTELFFRQAIGRVIRSVPGIDEQTAMVFLPSEPVLVEYAEKVKEEREHSLQMIEADLNDQLSRLNTGQLSFSGIDAPSFMTIGADDAQRVSTVFDGDHIENDEYQAIATALGQLGLSGRLSVGEGSKFLKAVGIRASQPATSSPQREPSPLHKIRDSLRKSLSTKIKRYNIAISGDYKSTWMRVKTAAGVNKYSKVDELTIAQLQAMVSAVDRLMTEGTGD